MGVKPRPKIDITNPLLFNHWWTYRSMPNDPALLAAAIEAGLVWMGESSIPWLTDKGRTLRSGSGFDPIMKALIARPSRLKPAAPTKRKRK